MYKRHAHCSFCGQAFAPDQPWPRTCAGCGNTSYLNPLPVAVLIVPVDGGVLTVRRSITPGLGELALPGGFIDLGESWQAAAVREAQEEAGLVIAPEEVADFYTRSSLDGFILTFGIVSPRSAAELPPFAPTPEASERVIVYEPVKLAFPLHTDALRAFFERQGQP